ncbi:MAG: hypothetical protein AAGB46_06770 [Verrucomicrobiota bacterium]
MKSLIILLIFSLLAPFAIAKKKDPPAPILLEPSEILYIQLIDSVYDGSDEDDRYYYFEETLDKVMEEFDFPMPYKVVRFGDRPPDNKMRLTIFLQMWGQNGIGEVEAKFSAQLRASRYHKNKLGYYRFTDINFAPTTSMARRTYNDVLKKALSEMARDLDERINYEFRGSEDSEAGDDEKASSPGSEGGKN